MAVHERGHRDDGELSQSNELDDIERVELFDRVQHGCNFGLDLAPESLPDLSDQVARLLPAAALCDVTEVCATSTLAPVEETAGEAPADPELPELFREFLTGSVTTGAQAERVAAQFTDLLHALDEERPPLQRQERRIEELLALAHQADRIAAGDYGDGPEPAPSHGRAAVSGAAPPERPSGAEGNSG